MKILRLLLGWSGCLLALGWGAASETPPPNVVLIISDDQAWGDYGFMGHPHIVTPNLDRLAAESLTFHRGYTPAPLCRPALASILTGLYPHQHGVIGNDPSLPDDTVNPMAARGNPRYAQYYADVIERFQQRPNLVRTLVSRGYLALQTGKWWEGDPRKTAGFTQAMTRGEGPGARHGDDGLVVGREGLRPVEMFLDGARERPWLLWYAPFLPHAPHTPPEALLAKYRVVAPSEPVARYWACVEWFDQTCGRLLDCLEERGLRDNTVVIYTTDNGWIQDPVNANRFAPRSKRTAYEGGVRTPIMVRWPGHVEPRSDREHLASNIDIWPTLGALLDIPIPQGLPGINLTDAGAVARRTRVFGEQYAHDIADISRPARSLEARWIIEGWWKLILPADTTAGPKSAELYDLRRDPAEERNRAAQEGVRLQAMLEMLNREWTPEGIVARPESPPREPRR